MFKLEACRRIYFVQAGQCLFFLFVSCVQDVEYCTYYGTIRVRENWKFVLTASLVPVERHDLRRCPADAESLTATRRDEPY
jgi:hypothetical protein